MLSPEFLDSLPENVVKLFAQVEQDILLDMAKRISKMDTVTDTAAWQAWRYEQTKLVSSNALKVLAKATGKSKTELVQLFQTAALETLQSDGKIYTAAGLAIPESLSPTLQNILQSGYLQTGKAMDNFTATTANTVTREFENALDRAWLQVNTGAFSYQQAIRRAILDLAQNGLHSVVYPSGHKDSIEVAVRRAVLTGINQTAAKLQLARMDELGCDLVETTAHAGARPSHAVWQGKIFSRSGKSGKYPDFVSSTGYGTGAGLGGWNCQHNFYPYFEGLSKRAYTDQQLKDFEKKEISYKGKDYTRYEASQIQRELERRIRKSKREYLALDAAGLDTSQAAATLAKRRQALKDFLKETGLRQDNFREQVTGFGKNAAGKAAALAKREKFAILKQITGARITDPESKAADLHAARYYGLVRSMKTDVEKIAKNTGFDKEKIAQIKQFIFLDKHDLGGPEPEYFAPDFAMAQSWQRLINGTPEPHDLTLLKHEIMEKELMDTGLSQSQAHNVTNQTYNYGEEVKRYYGELKKHRNRR